MKLFWLGLLLIASIQCRGQGIMSRLEEISNRSGLLQNAIYAHEAPFLESLDCKRILMYETLAQKTMMLISTIELTEYAVMVRKEMKNKDGSWLHTRSISNLQQLPTTLRRMKIEPNQNSPLYADEMDFMKIVADLESILLQINISQPSNPK
ncbi:MAG TPA: hypothetical protein VGK03_01825 [Geothrix sp.]|jgi:hypothetical protein